MKLMDSRFNLKLASNTDVLQAQKEYLEASTAYQKAVMDYHIARARIFHLCGTNLERYNIQVGPE
jgi:outer membrane protein TolC